MAVAASLYRRLQVPAGTHRFVVRLKDKEERRFDFIRDETISLKAGKAIVIDLKADATGVGGFINRK